MNLDRVVSRSIRVSKTQLTLLHFRNQFLIEQAASLLVQRTVDGDNITLSQHLFQVIYASAANFFLNLRLERLVVKVQQLLAVKWLESSQHAFADTPDSDCAHDLILEIVFVLCNRGDIPVSTRDLLMSWNKVANEGEDGHENMLCHGYHIGTSDFSDCDATVGFVPSIKVNVVGSNARSDGKFELLSFSESFGCQVTWVEANSNK